MCRVAIGKANTVFGKAIDVWCGDVLATLTTQVGIAKIIGQKDDNVWSITGCSSSNVPGSQDKSQDGNE